MIAVLIAALVMPIAPPQESARPPAQTITVTEHEPRYRYLDGVPRRVRVDMADLRTKAAVRSLQRSRLRLADDLDRMISAGDCTAARRTAAASGWLDISAEVERVCAAG